VTTRPPTDGHRYGYRPSAIGLAAGQAMDLEADVDELAPFADEGPVGEL
jgi:hypothetical protein